MQRYLRGVQNRLPFRSLRAAWAQRDLLDNRHLDMLLSWLLRRDCNCVDVGASRGDVLRRLVRLAPDGNHFAFEPLPEFARLLGESFPSVHVRNAAVSDTNGNASFNRVVNMPGLSGLRLRRWESGLDVEELSVEVTRLDDALPADYRPDLIKVDVEGAEETVLRGAMNVIARSSPVLVVEFGKGAADVYGSTPESMYELMSDLRYRIFDIDGVGPYSRETLAETFEANTIWNFVMHR